MKELLEELRTLNEEEAITPEVFKQIIEHSSFDYYSDSLEGDVKTDYILESPVWVMNDSSIKICTQEVFETIINDATMEFIINNLPKVFERYFYEDEFYKDCLEDKNMRSMVLKEQDIDSTEEVNIDGINYVILEG